MSKIYTTSDMAITSALCCYGKYTIDKITKEGTKCFFHFEKDNNFDTILEEIYSHKAKVDPFEYYNTIRQLKTRVYNT